MEKKNSDILDLNLSTTKNLKKLSKDEEIQLIKIVRKGELEKASEKDRMFARDAREKLFNHNIGMVYLILKKYSASSLSEAELLQYGFSGLMTAINKFDYNKGRFSTVAYPWIENAIKRGIEKRERIIKIPSRELEKIRLIRKTINAFLAKNGREPSIEEISSELKDRIKIKEIKELLVIAQSVTSLDALVTDDSTRLDYINDESTINPNDKKSLEEKSKK